MWAVGGDAGRFVMWILIALAGLMMLSPFLWVAFLNTKTWLTWRWRCHGSWMSGRWAHRHDLEWMVSHDERRWQLLRHLLDYPPARIRPKR